MIINIIEYFIQVFKLKFQLLKAILFLYLLIIFIILPIIEISIFIQVGGFLGTFNTILIIFLTAAVGVYFVRQQGFRTFQKIGVELQNQQIPVQGMFDGLVILIAGILLVTPGFLTDIIGFLGLVPQTRVLLLAMVKNFFFQRYQIQFYFKLWKFFLNFIFNNFKGFFMNFNFNFFIKNFFFINNFCYTTIKMVNNYQFLYFMKIDIILIQPDNTRFLSFGGTPRDFIILPAV